MYFFFQLVTMFVSKLTVTATLIEYCSVYVQDIADTISSTTAGIVHAANFFFLTHPKIIYCSASSKLSIIIPVNQQTYVVIIPRNVIDNFYPVLNNNLMAN